MTSKVETALSIIAKRLQEKGSVERAKGQVKYFKNVVQFHGLDSKLVQQVYKEHVSTTLAKQDMSLQEKLNLSYKLFESKFFEEKTIAGIILNKHIKAIMKEEGKAEEVLEYAKTNLLDTHMYDWGTIDTTSSRVFCEMIKLKPELAQVMLDWSKDETFKWRQRSACVSFVKIARFGKHNEVIYKIATNCIKNQYRFTQLGVGWMLRELSLADLTGVIAFIKKHYSLFTREGLRYAIEKMKPNMRKELLEYSTE